MIIDAHAHVSAPAGPDQSLFGAECPGVGSQLHPVTGKPLGDVAPSIRASGLSE
jgi:hypothetical protein